MIEESVVEELSERGYTVRKVVKSTRECTKLVVDDETYRYYVKCYPLKVIFRTAAERKVINNELTMAENFKKMDLNTCTQFVKRVYTKTTLYLFFNFYRHVTLESLISNKSLSEQQIVLIMRDLLAIIYELRGASVLHRHLSPDKILVTGSQLKFCSFKYCTDIRKIKYDTDEYMYLLKNKTNLFCIAPEVLLNTFTGFKTQIFSFGVLTYLLTHRCYPYESMQNDPQLEESPLNSVKRQKEVDGSHFKNDSKVLDEYVSNPGKLPKLNFNTFAKDKKPLYESTDKLNPLSVMNQSTTAIAPSKQIEYLKNYYASGNPKPYVDPRLTEDLFYTLKNSLKVSYNDRMALSEIKVTVGTLYKQIVQEEEVIRQKLYNVMNPSLKVDDAKPSNEALKEHLYGFKTKASEGSKMPKVMRKPLNHMPSIISYKMDNPEAFSRFEMDSDQNLHSKGIAGSPQRRSVRTHLETIVNRTEKVFLRPVSLGIMKRSLKAKTSRPLPLELLDA
jgi:serine/threonine protein kinase